jgi:hypothetical protein
MVCGRVSVSCHSDIKPFTDDPFGGFQYFNRLNSSAQFHFLLSIVLHLLCSSLRIDLSSNKCSRVTF